MKPKSEYVDSGLDNDGEKFGGWSVQFEYLPPRLPALTSGNYSQSLCIKGPKVMTIPDITGWRPPTSYYVTHRKKYGLPFELSPSNTRTPENPTGTSVTKCLGLSRPIAGTAFGFAPNDDLFFNPAGDPQVPDWIVDQAFAECKNKLLTGDVQLGANLGEAGQTAGLIADTIDTLWYLYLTATAKFGRSHLRPTSRSALWRLKRAYSQLTPTQVAKGWLAYQYGVKPLVHDLYQLASLLNVQLEETGSRVSASRTVTNDLPPVFLPTGPWVSASQDGRTLRSCHVDLHYTVANPLKRIGAGLGLTNPVGIAWELMPFSFVVDWMIPIGNVLSALMADLGLTFHGGSYTRRVYADLTYKVSPFVSGVYWEDQKDTVETRYRCLSMLRSPVVSPPLASLYIKSPFSTSHALNAIAIVGTLSGLK